ncbi:MAG: TIGR03885 family FMN-dependent LLM class oxidoreductase [Intrasporangium sp.]|uniref:TIGR03885 family FMN-dependent LLM class oxidoreductase n=1 Tax=Intrasporangium sp. TaxID=1925024 RepID=UPI003F7E02E3
MATIGFHCAHEQIAPSQLLADVVHAEASGFGAALCADRLSPWTTRQGQSGHAWSWLGAALARTSLSFGVLSSPGQRYHPAVLAQAIGTLAEMFPGRFWASFGSGQAINEHVTGSGWPRRELRERRLVECVDAIRLLLAGEEVSHDGLVSIDRARVWSRPEASPPLLGTALTEETAHWHGRWADGLVTTGQPPEVLRRIIDGYRQGGGRGWLALLVHLSWAPTEDEAIDLAMDHWPMGAFGPSVVLEIETVDGFDELARHVTEEQVRAAVRVSADLEQHVDWIRADLELGFDEIYLHFVGPDQGRFIDAFSSDVLPAFAEEPHEETVHENE